MIRTTMLPNITAFDSLYQNHRVRPYHRDLLRYWRHRGLITPSRPLFSDKRNYVPRRLDLSKILSNSSETPYTLSAFMTYLSSNHCMETLEFTMDASRYRKHYNKLAGRSPTGELVTDTEECTYIQSLWTKLL
jgi:DNA-binding transcriptional MerR regulator